MCQRHYEMYINKKKTHLDRKKTPKKLNIDYDELKREKLVKYILEYNSGLSALKNSVIKKISESTEKI